MKKEKIAISVDPSTLEMVDALVDGLTIRSRSQAIEYLISKGIEQQYIRDAVILIKGSDAGKLLTEVEGTPLLEHHLDWLQQHGVQNVYLVTGGTPQLAQIEALTGSRVPRVTVVVEEKPAGTIPALGLLKKELTRNFIVMLGDTLNRFDLTKMILFHLKNDRIATVGLISSDTPKKYSQVELEGDRIVEFRNKDSESHVIDAGIYIFKPLIFKQFSAGKKFLDRDVFPDLCHTNEIKGYFTHGKYVHLA